jgi:hypothetical protein
MKLLGLSNDVIRQILIYYIKNSRVNQMKIEFIGSKLLNEISRNIYIEEQPLFIACKNNDVTNAINLVNENSAGYVSKNGETSLMFAYEFGMEEVTSKLLKFRCKYNQVSKDGNTALYSLRTYNNNENFMAWISRCSRHG